jgi:hypothetical protein
VVPSAFAAAELAYDDGTAEVGQTFESGKYFAVRFSLPGGCKSARLLKARFYKAAPEHDDTDVKVHILGSDGLTELTAPFTYDVAVDDSWNDADLLLKNIIVTGDFWIAIEFLVSFDPYIGFDLSPATGHSYAGTPGNWLQNPEGNYLIRAVIECSAPVGGTVMSTDKLAVLTPYIALAGLVIAVSAVVVVKRRKA